MRLTQRPADLVWAQSPVPDNAAWRSSLDAALPFALNPTCSVAVACVPSDAPPSPMQGTQTMPTQAMRNIDCVGTSQLTFSRSSLLQGRSNIAAPNVHGELCPPTHRRRGLAAAELLGCSARAERGVGVGLAAFDAQRRRSDRRHAQRCGCFRRYLGLPRALATFPFRNGWCSLCQRISVTKSPLLDKRVVTLLRARVY